VHDHWWLDNFVKSHARKVADVMTREVVVAAPDTPLRDIAFAR